MFWLSVKWVAFGVALICVFYFLILPLFVAGKVVNLHPALPETFPGTHAIERAFTAYQRGEIAHTGVMVHLVPDEGVDSGPVLAQQVVSIEPDDTLETLAARMHATEHDLLVNTLHLLCAT